jgi:hypothetical protein
MNRGGLVLCSAVALGLMAPVVAAAQGQKQEYNRGKSQQEMVFEQGYGVGPEKFPAAYCAPARIDVRDSWDVFATGSFLYWWVGQDGMNFELPASSVVTVASTQTSNFSGVTFGQHMSWHPGFRAGLGANFDADNWVGYLEYTWMHERTHTSSGSTVSLADAPGQQGGFHASLGTGLASALGEWFLLTTVGLDGMERSAGVSLTSTWRVKYDQIDATLSRPFYQGRRLTVLPYGGARGFYLRQKYKMNLVRDSGQTVAADGAVSADTHCWAVGLLTGMNTHWLLGAGFRFEGDASVSLLYNRYIKQRMSMTVEGEPLFSVISPNRSTVRPMVDLAGGLGWGTYLDKQSYHLDFVANYEFLMLPYQNRLRQLLDSNNGEAAGALFMSGLTFTARLDF